MMLHEACRAPVRSELPGSALLERPAAADRVVGRHWHSTACCHQPCTHIHIHTCGPCRPATALFLTFFAACHQRSSKSRMRSGDTLLASSLWCSSRGPAGALMTAVLCQGEEAVGPEGTEHQNLLKHVNHMSMTAPLVSTIFENACAAFASLLFATHALLVEFFVSSNLPALHCWPTAKTTLPGMPQVSNMALHK